MADLCINRPPVIFAEISRNPLQISLIFALQQPSWTKSTYNFWEKQAPSKARYFAGLNSLIIGYFLEIFAIRRLFDPRGHHFLWDWKT